MKKLLLSLGALSAVVAPVAAVVACGSTNSDSKLDTIKKAAISSLDQFTGLSDEAKTTAINAINAAKDQAGVEAATQAATVSTQPGTALKDITNIVTDANIEKANTQIASLIDGYKDKNLAFGSDAAGVAYEAAVKRIFKLDHTNKVSDLKVELKVVNKGYIYKSSKTTTRYSEKALSASDITTLTNEFIKPLGGDHGVSSGAFAAQVTEIIPAEVKSPIIVYNDATTGYALAYTLDEFVATHNKIGFSTIDFKDIIKALNTLLA